MKLASRCVSPAALALLEEDDKILDEQVVFLAVPN